MPFARILKLAALTLACTALPLPCISLGQVAVDQPANSARELMERWIGLEQQRSSLESLWSRQEQQLRLRMQLLQAEKEQLGAVVHAGSEDSDDVEEERRRLLQRQASLEQEQQQVEETLARLIPALQATAQRLPPPLYTAWRHGLDALDTADGASEQLQIVLQLLRALDDFQQRVSSNESVITLTDGQRIQARQLYLGAVQGWFVTVDGSRAGRGAPGTSGWQWQLDADVGADTVVRALDMLEHNQDVGFVTLPLALHNAGGNP